MQPGLPPVSRPRFYFRRAQGRGCDGLIYTSLWARQLIGPSALFSRFQCEQSHLMREHEDVQERTTLRYEERITELHSIIAELNKKIDRLQGTTIR